jgi:hypothetical protein
MIMSGSRPDENECGELDSCPTRGVKLMRQCWAADPEARPSGFDEISKRLEEVHLSMAHMTTPREGKFSLDRSASVSDVVQWTGSGQDQLLSNTTAISTRSRSSSRCAVPEIFSTNPMHLAEQERVVQHQHQRKSLSGRHFSTSWRSAKLRAPTKGGVDMSRAMSFVFNPSLPPGKQDRQVHTAGAIESEVGNEGTHSGGVRDSDSDVSLHTVYSGGGDYDEEEGGDIFNADIDMISNPMMSGSSPDRSSNRTMSTATFSSNSIV